MGFQSTIRCLSELDRLKLYCTNCVSIVIIVIQLIEIEHIPVISVRKSSLSTDPVASEGHRQSTKAGLRAVWGVSPGSWGRAKAVPVHPSEGLITHNKSPCTVCVLYTVYNYIYIYTYILPIINIYIYIFIQSHLVVCT